MPSTQVLTRIFVVASLPLYDALASQPRNYAAQRTVTPIKIDGDIYKKVWEEVPWSQDFVEIRGADTPATAERPTTGTRTRMKMRWDDDFLYIATEMNANEWLLTADFTQRNEPIFQKDSDIEVFLDTDGSNSNYKELEVNARNTVWNLLLDKPYSVGGGEHSGRVAKEGERSYWEVQGQQTAAKVYGSIGKRLPNGKWTAEIALSHKDSLDRTKGSPPVVGKYWRINFSRVEKEGTVNWVWSPQMIWTPTVERYVGQVNMHAPDAWGYVLFTDAGAAAGSQDWVDPAWNLKAAAHQLFYAETLASKPDGGSRLLTPAELLQKKWINATLFDGLDAQVTEASKGDWSAVVRDSKGCSATIRSDNTFSYRCDTKFLGLSLTPARSALIGQSFACFSAMGALAVWFAYRQKSKLDGLSD